MTVVTDVLWGLGGMVAVLAVAVAFSTNRRRIRLRTVGLALLIQISLGILVLYVPAGQRVLEAVSNGVQGVIDSSAEGIEFLFGPVLPGENESVFAFQVLPVIVYFASLAGLLYYLNVLQQVVRFPGGALAKVLGTSRPAAYRQK
ncbi:MAG TPA: Na+ dependent nucleoside transporter N-terminal domain-containing protein [Jiangellaceae bacterium]|nr:Na+ dependent nucleoside transporter N-terminal domain-containing protein [Jiangellaceae bacterium]